MERPNSALAPVLVLLSVCGCVRACTLARSACTVYLHFGRCDQRAAHLNSPLSARFKVGLRLNHGQHDEAPLEGPSPPTPQKKTSRLIGRHASACVFMVRIYSDRVDKISCFG